MGVFHGFTNCTNGTNRAKRFVLSAKSIIITDENV